MDIDSVTPPPLPPPPLLPSNGTPSIVAHAQPQQPASHVAIDGASAPDRRPKKSSSTCAICRFRKVRCNGARPACSNCQRLGFPCSYDDADVDAWAVSLPRRRVKQACLSCHSRKARCSGHIPSCERCRVQGIECIYRPSKRASTARLPIGHGDGKSPTSPEMDVERDWSRDKDRSRNRDRDDGRHDSPASTDPASAASPSLNNLEGPCPDEAFDAVIGRTFDMFFRHVHHIPMYCFLHRASLMEQYHAGKVDKALLLALVGITSCLTDMGQGMRRYGDRCIEEAEALLLSDYNRPSTIKVQAIVFIIRHRILSNKFSSAFILHSLASRFAAALRLNFDAPHLCFLAQESRRRLMWALYSIDSSVSGGYSDFTLWRADRIHIGLPCNERNFEFDLPQNTEKLIPDSHQPPSQVEDIGSIALHVRILHIRHRITEFTKVALFDRGMEAAELQGRILALDKELDNFANHLPTSFQFSENSLRLRAYSPRICAFVMIHVWWRQCHCDLYCLALAGIRGGLPQSALEMFDAGFLQHCQRQCLDHSLALANIFSVMQKLNAKPVADIDLAMCAYQCARMLRYLYQVSGATRFGLAADTVMEQARICLQTIKDCCMGPAVTCIKTDLENLIGRGLTTGLSPMQADSPEASRVAGTAASSNMSQQAIIQNLQVTDESEALCGSNSAVHATTNAAALPSFTPTPSSTMASAPSPFPPPHPVMAPVWMSESNFAHDLEQQALPDVQPAHSKAGAPDLPLSREFVPSELNNAYEGAFEGLGLDNGLDYAMGIDVDVWAPTAGGWVGPEFASSWAGV